MNARARFRQAERTQSDSLPFVAHFTVASLGFTDYDSLFSEVMMSIADFRSCVQTEISLEFQRRGVAHFYYNGVLVIRLPSIEEGFFFA